ncbi:serine/threonine protein kinase, partial [Streptomyces sp. E11-3]
ATAATAAALDQAPTAAARHQPHPYAATRQYTAQHAQVPRPASAIARPSRRRKRPGPPPKVTVPVLLLALACFAVGFWALAQT